MNDAAQLRGAEPCWGDWFGVAGCDGHRFPLSLWR